MEDAFALVVLTLLQLCRAEISNTEWYAANLVNDPSYTPKPLTEIFNTDLTFIPKDPPVSSPITSRTTPSTTTSSPISTTPTTKFENGDTTTQQNQPQRIPIQIVGISQQPQIFSQPADPKNDLPSFVLIFDPRQQTSQIFQQPLVTPLPAIQSTTEGTISTTTPPPSTQSTRQTTTIVPRNLQPQTNPLTVSVGSSNAVPGRWNIRNFIFPLPNFPNGIRGCNSTAQNPIGVSSTLAPQTISPGSGKPVLTVRVKAPKGSRTNIRINPTTTTRKPSTTRRRKSNKRTNDYEICLNSCKGKKEPICSSPVGIFPIDPDRLKGFASLCHMACHNSYKNDQGYNKVVDGRCGRLRTRIRPVDKNKLNRDELNKAQYTITHNAPETLMQFSPLNR